MKKLLTEAEKAFIKFINDAYSEAGLDVEDDMFIEGRFTVSTNKNEYPITISTGAVIDGRYRDIEPMDDCSLDKLFEETLDRLEDDEDEVAVYADFLVRKKIKID